MTEDDFRAWADAWVARQDPDRIRRLIFEEADHVAAFNQDLGRFTVQFEAVNSAYLWLLDDLNFVPKNHWPAHRNVQYVLLAYNATSFHSAFDRLLRGHYEDSITLTRGLYETFVRAMWISTHSEHPYNALIRDVPAGQPRFNLTNFLRDHLHLDWSSSYSTLSAFAHSNGYLALDALTRAAQQGGEPERFEARITYKPDLAVTATALLSFAVTTHLRFAVERLMDGTQTVSYTHLTLPTN